jgi:hypothetical protein
VPGTAPQGPRSPGLMMCFPILSLPLLYEHVNPRLANMEDGCQGLSSSPDDSR